MTSERELVAGIEERARAVGVRVWLQAVDVDGTARVGIDQDEPVVTASVFKVPIAVELARQAAAGELDLAEQVTVPADHPTASPYGLATFRHDTTMSLDALATLMIGISDNVATDVVYDRVGKANVAALLDALGLADTAVLQDCRELLATIAEDLDMDYQDDEVALAGLTAEQLASLRALQPEHTCRTTAADITALLSMIWRDEAAPPSACADVRRWLGLQVWPHRLRSGFARDDVVISGKTGTLPTIRNEVGIIEYPDGDRYAVGVFTRATDARSRVPARDAFIGESAARAVTWLREGR